MATPASRRNLFLLFGAFVVVVVLAVGLGVGLHDRDHNSKDSVSGGSRSGSSSSSSSSLSTTASPSPTDTTSSATATSSHTTGSSSVSSSTITPYSLSSSGSTSTGSLPSSLSSVGSSTSITSALSSPVGSSTSITSALSTSVSSSTGITSSPSSSGDSSDSSTSSQSSSVAGSTRTTSSVSSSASSASSSASSITSSIATTPTIAASSSTTPINPVSTASAPQFLGNVTSNNTYDIRDCGWQGQIGSTFLNAFGDTIPCSTAYQVGCFGLEAPSSAGLPITPTTYYDFDTGANGKHATIFCPLEDGETDSYGFGITNVVAMTETQGIGFFQLANRSGSTTVQTGSGVAVIDVSGPKPVCTRPWVYWWEPTEPIWGDHGTVLGPDNYIYSYGGMTTVGGGSDLFLLRVQQSLALNLTAYEYWNGSAYTPDRLYNPSVDQTVLTTGQGTVIWHPYYKMYLYFRPGCYGYCILVTAAHQPEGPWSDTYNIFSSSQGPNGYQFYGPAVQPKWSDANMMHLVIYVTGRGTGFGNIIQAINVTFA